MCNLSVCCLEIGYYWGCLWFYFEGMGFCILIFEGIVRFVNLLLRFFNIIIVSFCLFGCGFIVVDKLVLNILYMFFKLLELCEVCLILEVVVYFGCVIFEMGLFRIL